MGDRSLGWKVIVVPKMSRDSLIDIESLKSYMDIPEGYETLASIIEAANMASAHIQKECKRNFVIKKYSEIISSRGFASEFVSATPLISVDSIEIRRGGGSWELVDLEEEPIDFSHDGEILIQEGYFPRGTNNIRVTYTSGYSSIPHDIRYAAMVLTEYYYRLGKDRRVGQRSRGKMNETTAWTTDIPEQITALWANHVTHPNLWDARYLKVLE